MEELDWAKLVNDLDEEPLSEKGLNPPDLEVIRKKKLGLEDAGDFSKLSMVVYFFVDKETGKTYTMQKHWIVEYGEVTLRDALLTIKKQT